MLQHQRLRSPFARQIGKGHRLLTVNCKLEGVFNVCLERGDYVSHTAKQMILGVSLGVFLNTAHRKNGRRRP